LVLSDYKIPCIGFYFWWEIKRERVLRCVRQIAYLIEAPFLPIFRDIFG